MTRPSPAPIVRDLQELRSILLSLPWVPREDEKQDIDASRADYDPDVSRRAMKP